MFVPPLNPLLLHGRLFLVGCCVLMSSVAVWGHKVNYFHALFSASQTMGYTSPHPILPTHSHPSHLLAWLSSSTHANFYLIVVPPLMLATEGQHTIPPPYFWWSSLSSHLKHNNQLWHSQIHSGRLPLHPLLLRAQLFLVGCCVPLFGPWLHKAKM